jgi:hypothetical protein
MPSVALRPRGPTVYQAPRWPMDTLAPLLLRLSRKPGRSVTRLKKRIVIAPSSTARPVRLPQDFLGFEQFGDGFVFHRLSFAQGR